MKLLQLVIIALSVAPSCTHAMIIRHDTSLPEIQWITTEPGSPAHTARKGGKIQLPITSFPEHLRRFGPQTPHSASALLESLHFPLMARNPTDEHWLPALASHWGVDDKQNILYVRLHEKAQWSDGTPVSTRDIEYTLRFLTNPENATTWQRDRLLTRIRQVDIADDQHIAFHLNTPFNDAIEEVANIRPLAAHFYEAHTWPDDMNWQPEPVTGPYRITQIKHDKSLTLQRDTDWWGRSEAMFVNRFNIRRIVLRYTASSAEAVSLFRNGELDSIPVRAENLAHPDLLSLHRQYRVSVLQNQINHQKGLLLLNPVHPALHSRAGRLRILSKQTFVSDSLAIPDLITLKQQTPPEWLTAFRQEPLPYPDWLAKVQAGQFSMAWIQAESVSQTMLNALLPQWTTEYGSSEQWQALGIIREFKSTENHYTLFWEWMRFPEQLVQHTARAFDPFDVIHGGQFWLDRESRSQIMATPERSNAYPAGSLIIDHNGHTTWQSLQ